MLGAYPGPARRAEWVARVGETFEINLVPKQLWVSISSSYLPPGVPPLELSELESRTRFVGSSRDYANTQDSSGPNLCSDGSFGRPVSSDPDFATSFDFVSTEDLRSVGGSINRLNFDLLPEFVSERVERINRTSTPYRKALLWACFKGNARQWIKFRVRDYKSRTFLQLAEDIKALIPTNATKAGPKDERRPNLPPILPIKTAARNPNIDFKYYVQNLADDIEGKRKDRPCERLLAGFDGEAREWINTCVPNYKSLGFNDLVIALKAIPMKDKSVADAKEAGLAAERRAQRARARELGMPLEIQEIPPILTAVKDPSVDFYRYSKAIARVILADKNRSNKLSPYKQLWASFKGEARLWVFEQIPNCLELDFEGLVNAIGRVPSKGSRRKRIRR